MKPEKREYPYDLPLRFRVLITTLTILLFGGALLEMISLVFFDSLYFAGIGVGMIATAGCVVIIIGLIGLIAWTIKS